MSAAPPISAPSQGIRDMKTFRTCVSGELLRLEGVLLPRCRELLGTGSGWRT